MPVLVRWPVVPRHRPQYADLVRVLDFAGIVPTYRAARTAIRAGAVSVDGAVETNLKRKLEIGKEYNVIARHVVSGETGGDLIVIASSRSGARRPRQQGPVVSMYKG